MNYPFNKNEIESINANRGLFGKLGTFLEKRRILAERQKRLFDCWTPDSELMGKGVQGWVETLESITSVGTQISNSSSETIIAPDFNIPAYYMAAGRTLRTFSFGVMSNVVTTPGTLIMRTRWGGVGGTVLTQSGAQGLDTTARTNSIWAMLNYIVCQTAGSSGSFMSGGMLWGNVLSSTAANLLPAVMGSAGTPLASGNVAVTVSTIVANLLSHTAQFSVATSPTNLTCQVLVVEALN